MITKNQLITGTVCGVICVAFMWVFMMATGMRMHMRSDDEMSGMHKMSDGSMMNHENKMDMTGNMGDMTMNEMSQMMKGKSGKDLEREFITGMIPHHQGAVDMAKVLLADKTISVELRTFAEGIIKAQDGEIAQMKEWLKKY
jgi:uncharacterized protein (DUF305 family)